MQEQVKKELWELAKAIAQRPTSSINTSQMREQLKQVLNEAEVENVLVLEHGQPKAVILDYKTYELFLKMVQRVTFEVAEEEIPDLSDEEFRALEEKRIAKRPARAQL